MRGGTRGVTSVLTAAAVVFMPTLLQDPGDRRSRHTVTKVLERTLNARVAPTRILHGHPDHEPPDFNLHPAASVAR
jgi:hypothetical protein